MERISSKDNAYIKHLKKLVSSAKYRREESEIFLEGARLTFDAVKSGKKLKSLIYTDGAFAKYEEEIKNAEKNALRVIEIPNNIASLVSDTVNSQGVFSVVEMPCGIDEEYKGNIIILEDLQDPGNVGTIIRCAEAFGMNRVIVTKNTADVWSPKVLRSAMGSALRENITVTDDIAKTIEALKKRGFSVYGAALRKNADTPRAMKKGSGMAVIIGNEGNGLKAETIDLCTGTVYIPMTDKIESLNAATAATVLMWEMSNMDM